jgi:hypothetical protein
VLRDAAGWPDWSETVDDLRLLDEGPFGLGSRARVKQPKMSVLTWKVTESTALESRPGGLTVLGLLLGWLIPVTSPVVIAIDDTLFRRRGKKVYADEWAYDGSLDIPRGHETLPGQ